MGLRRPPPTVALTTVQRTVGLPARVFGDRVETGPDGRRRRSTGRAGWRPVGHAPATPTGSRV
eukprot:4736290-Alexandrium_andersonii.AAC.1